MTFPEMESLAIKKLNEIYDVIPSHLSTYADFLKKHHEDEYNKLFTRK